MEIGLRGDRLLVGHRGHGCSHSGRFGWIGRQVESKISLAAGRGDIMNLFHVNLQVICSLEHLAALAAWVGDKASLMLMTNVSE